MKNLLSKIMLLSIITLAPQVSAQVANQYPGLAPTDRQIINNNLQVGKIDDKVQYEKDLCVTRQTFLRGNLVIGEGSNFTDRKETVRAPGCNRTFGTYSFNPNTQLLCIEFNERSCQRNGAWVNLIYSGGAHQQECDYITPISATYDKLFVCSYRLCNSDSWGDIRVLDDKYGSTCDIPNGTNITNFDLISDQYPYIDNACVESTKVYVGLFDNDEDDEYFYLQEYCHIFGNGSLFVEATSANIKNITVVDIPQDYFDLAYCSLKEKIRCVVNDQCHHNVFQIFGVAHYIRTTPGEVEGTTVEDELNALLDAEEFCQVSEIIYDIWANLYRCEA